MTYSVIHFRISESCLEPQEPVGFVQAIRTRRTYVVPAGEWIGFGRERPEQEDLFEITYRVGRWRINVCHACLIARIALLQRALNEAKALLQRRQETK